MSIGAIPRKVRPWWWSGLMGAIALLVALWPQANLAGEGRLISLWQRPDGTQVAYYAAGDDFLLAAFALLEDYWQEVRTANPDLVRGHLDTYLPSALKTLTYEPADAWMHEFAQAFFAARHAPTGLIPYAYDTPIAGNPQRPAEADLTTGEMQPVSLIARAMEFCTWFPGDRTLQTHCRELAHSTINYFDVAAPEAATSGLWGWVNVAGDRAPRRSLTLIQDYGEVAWGMAQLSQHTADPQFAQWADAKLQFVWQHPMNADLPLLHEQFVLTQALHRPDEPSSDTDTLYFVRRLFDLYDLTGNTEYRDWALAVTDLWCDRAWNPRWGHFVRKLKPDGTPAVDTLYGDGKYNTLYILVQAYEVTGNPAYLERLKQAWDTLVNLGDHGLAPAAVQRGRADPAAELDAEQTIFLDILVRAYEASGDRTFRQAATALGQAILQQGPAVMRRESGQAAQAFLRLALACQPIRRVPLTLDQPHTPLAIEQAGHLILQATPPTTEIIVYLPRGPYEVSLQPPGTPG